jgi:hypothetical protein
MRILFVSAMTSVAGALVSCGADHHTGSEAKDAPLTVTVSQVNPNAFNAFNIWRDGQGAEILDYPRDYESITNKKTSDGVFYINPYDYYLRNFTFVGTPTKGAIVVNDVLEYPAQNGKQLKLKFTEFTTVSEQGISHSDAVTHCINEGLRLPTVRELFDFCAAGVTEPNYGPNFKNGKYPSTARCKDKWAWSASVVSNARHYAWLFDGGNGGVIYWSRNYGTGVRCVGGE